MRNRVAEVVRPDWRSDLPIVLQPLHACDGVWACVDDVRDLGVDDINVTHISGPIDEQSVVVLVSAPFVLELIEWEVPAHVLRTIYPNDPDASG